MTIDEIKAVAEMWMEWPDERREYVTYTSAMLFARDMYEAGQAVERERRKSKARLTDDEISQVGKDSKSVEGNHTLPFTFARAIEQKIWEKNE